MQDVEGADALPVALLDFDMPPRGEDRPQEAFSALLMLRRELVRYGLRFPLFDFACVVYLLKTSALTPERVRALLPTDDLDLLVESIKIITEVPGIDLAKAVLSLFSKHLSVRFTLYAQARNLTTADVEMIRDLDPYTELPDRLPELFAKDLSAAVAGTTAPKRVVLLFDTHEAFWGHQRALPDAVVFQRDEWVRSLLSHLSASKGVVVVLAGRDRPRWSELGRVWSDFVDFHIVDNLACSDADRFLQRAGIDNEALRGAVIRYTSVAEDQVHPLYLAFCADVIRSASLTGTALAPHDFPTLPDTVERDRELVRHLLRYVSKEYEIAIRCLSVCRVFDEDIYLELGKTLRFDTSRSSFAIVTGFSFIWPAESMGHASYRVHSQLRRILQHLDDGVLRTAHICMEHYYRGETEGLGVSALAEAIYHANQTDWRRGVMEWMSAFKSALDDSRFSDCSILLDIRKDLTVEDDLISGEVAYLAGEYLMHVGRHTSAEREFAEAVSRYKQARSILISMEGLYDQFARVFLRKGSLETVLGRHEAAIDDFDRALAIYEEGLRSEPGDRVLLANMGLVHSDKGAPLPPTTRLTPLTSPHFCQNLARSRLSITKERFSKGSQHFMQSCRTTTVPSKVTSKLYTAAHN